MRFIGAFGAILAAAALAPASFAAPPAKATPFVGSGVRERLASEGRVRVLVSLGDAGGEEPARPSGLEVVRSLSGGRILAGWLTPGAFAELASSAPARAVVLDRLVRPAGQVGTAQIGADRLLGAGLSGLGRTIGIVDTGIDLYHPDLGADASGPGRVIGGWNFADGNSDIYDCEGHGTAVAGVAAGALGVAPEASIVALKVFGARDGCATAYASDVLAAVDWALGRREQLGIDVVNLSLADDRVRSGFCDAEDPVSSELFGRARAEGLAVVAAAGNSGHVDALAWPACLSDVVSVGMVYSVGQGPTFWGADAHCTDAVTGPDVVPCASNGGAALSMLAPGVRWLVPTAGGGRQTTFSGTSAAAPAVAASLLLTRQFAPVRDPLLSADFLRLTGVPVTDERTGAATPRLDVGSAFVSPSPFTGPCEQVAASDSAPGALVCRARVPFLAGDVTTLAVSLSLEHPNLARLRAWLIAPDGTTVRLLNGIRRSSTTFREVIGRTIESEEPLSLLAGHPAAGDWTLRLEADTASSSIRLRSWAVVVEPEASRPTATKAPFNQLLPTVARTSGRFGAFFSSDAVVFNPDELASADVTLTFFPAGAPAEQAVAVTLRVPPLATRTFQDVVGNVFRTSGSGPLHVSAPEDVVVASRTETTIAGGGSYGLLAEGVAPTGGIAFGDPSAWLAPVFRPSSSRVNLGFVEVAGAAVSAEVLIRDGAGSVKGRFTIDLEPFGSRQVNGAHRFVSADASSADIFEVRVLSGAGRIVSWATAVDNGSNDGLLVVASKPRHDAYLPAAARSPGRFGAFFRTDLKLSNPWPSPVNVRFSFFPSKGTSAGVLILSLGAWETRVLEDVLSSLLDVREDTAGALRVTALGTSPGIVASSRTYTEEPERSYGLAIGLLENAEAGAGERIALTFLSSSPETRTNLGFLETSGVETAVRVSLYDERGKVVAAREFTLKPRQAVQWNDVFAEMGAPPAESASAIVDVVRGGAVIAHAIRVDNRTNDASFLPGRVLRTRLFPAGR